MARFDLTDKEWAVIEPLLPTAGTRGAAGRRPQGALGDLLAAEDRRAVADLPERYGPHTTCDNRFVRWRRGIWGRILEAFQ